MLKKMILNAKGKVSWTKAGAWVVAAAAALLSEGLIPASGVWAAKVVITLGTVTAVVGARDALDK